MDSSLLSCPSGTILSKSHGIGAKVGAVSKADVPAGEAGGTHSALIQSVDTASAAGTFCPGRGGHWCAGESPVWAACQGQVLSVGPRGRGGKNQATRDWCHTRVWSNTQTRWRQSGSGSRSHRDAGALGQRLPLRSVWGRNSPFILDLQCFYNS